MAGGLLQVAGLEGPQVRHVPRRPKLLLPGEGHEELLGVGEEDLQGLLCPGVALLRPLAEPFHPKGRVPKVEALLLEGPLRHLREGPIGAPPSLGKPEVLVEVKKVLPDHGEGPVPLGKLHQDGVLVLQGVPQEDELIKIRFRVTGVGPVQLAPQLQVELGVAQLVLGQVGDGDVLLEDGGVGHPLGEALGQDHLVVGQGGELGDEGLLQAGVKHPPSPWR